MEAGGYVSKMTHRHGWQVRVGKLFSFVSYEVSYEFLFRVLRLVG